MSAKEFWEDDPQLFASYRAFFIKKKQREVEELDYSSWLSGLYNHYGEKILFDNLSVSISKMLGDKKGKYNKNTYPKKPFNELEKDKMFSRDKLLKETEYKKSLLYFGKIKQAMLEKVKKQKK